ncbi:stage II sporulation protein P [Clostridium sp. SYSU_GA19001]|uniref:stage II sporulation protein P n=1 Tax=Clostridium caldaquaticum TaxID=2940653 RepID=UPI002077325C|nr:stage II sporulation protein P [Clostridium caldaquaticum]MCM8709559.1 stage II sporulation protein P [Clostridium caldaquaticum]
MLKNKNTKGKIYTSLSLSLLLTLSVPLTAKAGTEDTVSFDKSMYYIEVMKNALPLLKSMNLDEDDMAEADFSLTDKFLEMMGLDVNSPLSIVSREFNLIKDGDPKGIARDTTTPFTLNPFKLNENNIIKNTDVKTTDSNTPVDYTKIAEVYNAKLKKTLNPAKPEVLIYHTHTTESYKPYAANVSDDQSKTVVAVGDVIANELEKNYGIAVIHDKTVHNMVFNKSYARSGETLDKYLNKYKDFKVIIDLHRDGGPKKEDVTVSMHSSNVARLIFVEGPGNPNKDKNAALMKKLVNIGQSLFPGLIRPGNQGDYGIYVHNNGTKFNQQKSPNALLLEVGSENNTLEEAKTSGVYVARILAEYINGKQ